MTAAQKPGAADPITVLICDDQASIRALLRDVIALRPSLRLIGEAADGDDVIVEAERLRPDVILLDLAMPRRTGLDALVELRLRVPTARIVVFSGFLQAGVLDDVRALGAVRYLEKGATPEAINDAIEAAAALDREVAATTGFAPGARP
jgi:DNA-binding NarL/FixJ family response regulator